MALALSDLQREDNNMAQRERRFDNERQPLLPFSAAYRAMNRLDHEREARNPLQLDLLPPLQPDLFIELAGAASNDARG